MINAETDLTVVGETAAGAEAVAVAESTPSPLFNDPPLLAIAPFASGSFDLYGSDGDLLGSFTSAENVGNTLGINSTQFAFDSASFQPADGVDADSVDLPEDGTIYSVTNLGSGIYNVYTAAPGDGGAGGAGDSATITDTLVTPWGNVDIPTSADFFNPFALDGTDAFDGGFDTAGPELFGGLFDLF